jgi:hypothetical protein
MSGNISTGTTVFSNVSLITAHIAGGPVLSAGSMDLRTNNVILSMATAANSSGRTIGELTLVFAASGISLMYSSGKSTYIVAGSAVSGAQG